MGGRTINILDKKDEKILGVLGGMGPEATMDFMKEVFEHTPAEEDQDHIQMFVVNDPKVPDRTEYILGEGEDPTPRLRKNAKKLESAGSDLIAVPCNTFHYFYDDINESVEIPIINMIEETRKYIIGQGYERVGLLSTKGTKKMGIYQSELEPYNIELITPEDPEPVMNAIYEIKSGEKVLPRKDLIEAKNKLLEEGAETVIEGCTEIPLVLENKDSELVNPTRILAKKVINEIKN